MNGSRRIILDAVEVAGREAEAGAKVPELCRRNGISEATYYNWKARYGGMDVSQLRRLKELETENADADRCATGPEPAARAEGQYRPL